MLHWLAALSAKHALQIHQEGKSRNTNTRTGNPFFRKMSTTLLPTPPVAPATRIIPEVSMAFSGLVGDGLDSFSIRNSKNFTIPKHLILVSKGKISSPCQKRSKLEQTPCLTLAGDGGPFLIYPTISKTIPDDKTYPFHSEREFWYCLRINFLLLHLLLPDI